MEQNLFSFIWKYSKREQILLLVLTLLSFPFLYASLELPKRIINDAIGAPTAQIDLWGRSLSQTEYLLLLSFAFLGTVLIGGLMKMYINTRKGVLSERMLRRLRYTLIARMMRFPKPYFHTTSQGELVSMITSESEPMGGLMGDAIAQPVFQFGQMATIVTFLFLQNVWFGLAAVALIPLQAWLIPKLQRQINLLNKDRIKEVRHLATEIGESAAGISDLRANGGWRYRLAVITHRLGTLFDIRFRIYKKKFFMKFLNNLISQMTPFLFYSVGGVLAIRGEITVGALVAALGAYKDLSAPWKELLPYYHQVQDMSLRWQVVTERFAPRNMIPEHLFEGEPDRMPHFLGSIDLKNVTVRDEDGNTILEDISLTIPPGARVAIHSTRASERAAIGELLTREVLPTQGDVTLSGQKLNDLHQAVIAARVGYAHSQPYLFDGTLGDNLLMPLRIKPQEVVWDPNQKDKRAQEARRSGNSTDSLDANWLDPDIANLRDGEDIRDWWFSLVQAMGVDEMMFRRTLKTVLDPIQHPMLAREIVNLRAEVREKLAQEGLDRFVHGFDWDEFNPAIPLAGNLLFAAPTTEITPDSIVQERVFIDLLHQEDLIEQTMAVSLGVIDTLNRIFGRDGADHPLFLRLGMDPAMYQDLSELAQRQKRGGRRKLSEVETARLLTVPFMLTAEQIGSDFPEEYKEKILSIRHNRADWLQKHLGSRFVPVSETTYNPRLTVTENAIYGCVSATAGANAERIEDVVAEVFRDHELQRKIAAVVHDFPTGIAGSKVPTVFQERAAFSRAGIKRPDILVLNHALASHDSENRMHTRQRLRELMPRTTMIFLEDRFEHPEAYDMFIEIKDGRIGDVERTEPGSDASDDLGRKLAMLMETDLFESLDPRNRRLLAYSAQWFEAEPGQVVFQAGQQADAVYLCCSGRAELRWPGSDAISAPVSTVEPGRLIGDLAVITKDRRFLDLIAMDHTRFLRIGAEEFRLVIESDAKVATQLLQMVANNLSVAAEQIQLARKHVEDTGSGPWPRLDR
jgi:putative ABC transport system ATP-binding protein